MIEFLPPPHVKDSDLDSSHLRATPQQRLDCSICHYHLDRDRIPTLISFSCNVRAFAEETFKVWRCPDCGTIHCLDVVDLPHYYAQYPFAHAHLSWPLRICYQNILGQLTRHGFSLTRSLLDYGCGSGLFVQYLQQRGFTNSYGYDPYAPLDGFGNPNILQQGPFDYILLQDVIEHVEDAHDLLSQLNALLSPTGYLLIGTPNAANVDLSQSHLSDHYNPVHVPYHLHLYTPKSLERLGQMQGWQLAEFCDRPFHDTPWFGLNARAWNVYQRLGDGTIDSIFAPLNLGKALTSPDFLFYALLGYWLSYKTEMSLMFRKAGG